MWLYFMFLGNVSHYVFGMYVRYTAKLFQTGRGGIRQGAGLIDINRLLQELQIFVVCSGICSVFSLSISFYITDLSNNTIMYPTN